MNIPAAENYTFNALDGVENRLTRYRGGSKGPVMVVHGAAVWSGMFSLRTIDENFISYLVKNGYDVWLLDWRASIKLPLRQFTLDDAAENDFPAAIRFIKEQTRSDSIQAVVHCAGASAFFMTLASGLAPDVRCVACSQIALHYKVPPAMETKCLLHLDVELKSIGLDYLSCTDEPEHPQFQSLLTEFVNLVHHECTSSVCHRITFLFGHLYRHDKLNAATHGRLAEQFGKCNITAFRHLAQIIRHGSALKYDYGHAENLRRYGAADPPSYLKAEHLRLPITFVSGALNRTYLPVSTEETFDWLKANNDPALYKRYVVPEYGHIDNFMGYRANIDSYPLFLEQLEACPA
jgi:pimeloyl-ACP methyl ester carboxylesterase